MGAFDGKAFGFELADQEPQQGVVAPPRRGDHPRQGLQAAQVGLERREVRALDHARQADGLTSGLVQGGEALAELGDAQVRAVEGGHLGVGHALQPDDEQGPAGGFALIRQTDGQLPSPGDQTELAHRP